MICDLLGQGPSGLSSINSQKERRLYGLQNRNNQRQGEETMLKEPLELALQEMHKEYAALLDKVSQEYARMDIDPDRVDESAPAYLQKLAQTVPTSGIAALKVLLMVRKGARNPEDRQAVTRETTRVFNQCAMGAPPPPPVLNPGEAAIDHRERFLFFSLSGMSNTVQIRLKYAFLMFASWFSGAALTIAQYSHYAPDQDTSAAGMNQDGAYGDKMTPNVFWNQARHHPEAKTPELKQQFQFNSLARVYQVVSMLDLQFSGITGLSGQIPARLTYSNHILKRLVSSKEHSSALFCTDHDFACLVLIFLGLGGCRTDWADESLAEVLP